MACKTPGLKVVPTGQLNDGTNVHQLFKILESYNTTDYLPGREMGKKVVDDLIHNGWNIKVVAPRRNR